MTLLLDDITGRENMFPFGQVRSMAHIRIGMMTLLERWIYLLEDNVQLLSQHPDKGIDPGMRSVLHIPSPEWLQSFSRGIEDREDTEARSLKNAADIFRLNSQILCQDFEMLTKGKKTAPIPKEALVKCTEKIFIDKGAHLSHCSINAEAGPVYISKDAEIMEGVMIRGPVFIGAHSVVKMGAKIYGGTTIGPYCMVGGEIKNSVLMAFSNKAHDGYLGDSVLGEWCNLGAGTSNSNLKNNASEVTLFRGTEHSIVHAGKKCGLLMGDYSRSAINTAFNTGTVVGISCNIFGGAPDKYVKNFAWGNEIYQLDKALRDINNWKSLKGFEITEEEITTIKKIYQQQ